MRGQQRTKRKRQLLWSVRWSVITLFIFIVLCAMKTFAKRSGSQFSLESDLIVCRITVEDTICHSDAPHLYSLEETVCVPIIDGTEYRETFRVRLPDDIIEGFYSKMKVGQLYVDITKASIRHDAIVTT